MDGSMYLGYNLWPACASVLPPKTVNKLVFKINPSLERRKEGINQSQVRGTGGTSAYVSIH
jgi:hypothetical protein